MQRYFSILFDATTRLIYDGGLSNAGNLALALLLSLFPFVILVAILVGWLGEPELFEQILALLFSHWPEDSARPIAEQIKVVSSQASGELFTLSNLIALILATNGIESARDGLNRAYGFREHRSFWIRRLQGALFVITVAIGLILAAFILIGTPVIWDFATQEIEWLGQFSLVVGLVQYASAILLLGMVLFSFHRFLPAGRLTSGRIIWGVLLTLLAILVGSQLFALYLRFFADYASVYAGMASIMIAIIYLYCLSVVILFGAEINAAIAAKMPGTPKENQTAS